MRLLAIDPGPVESAYVILRDGKLQDFGKLPNRDVSKLMESGKFISHVVCERIRSFGMPAGAELFETCEWCGRFWQVAAQQGIDWRWLTRNEVKNHLCHSSKAKDANIRQAIIDRLGPVGTKKNPGPCYGISKDVWSALAVALTWMDRQEVAA